MAVKLRGRFKPKNRVELDKVLKDHGMDAKLFRTPEHREKSEWILKQMRTGGDRKTVVFDKP
ncbi:MAG: hypothetical protein ACKV2Q_36475 [Planctomycetaceae bacterium]